MVDVRNGMGWTKKAFAAALALALLFGLLPPSAPIRANEQDGLSLEEAWNRALAGNAELRMIEERIRLTEARLEEAKEDVRYARDRHSNKPSEEVSLRKREQTIPMTAETDLWELREEKEKLLAETRLSLTATMARLGVVERQLESVRQELALAEERIAAQRKRIETGQDIPSSLGAFEVEKLQLEVRRAELNGQRELLLLEAAKALGVERGLLPKLRRLPVPDVTDYTLPDIEALAKRAAESHVSVKIAEKRAEIADLEYQFVQKAYQYEVDLENEIRNAEDAAYIALLAVRDARIEAERKVRSDALAIQNALDEVAIAELNLELANKRAEMDEKRHELGMITNTDRLASKLQALSAAAELEQAKIALYETVERFEFFIQNIE